MRIVRVTGFFTVLFLLSCDTFRNEKSGCPDIQGVLFNVTGIDISNQQFSECCEEPIGAYKKVAFPAYRLCMHFDAVYYNA